MVKGTRSMRIATVICLIGLLAGPAAAGEKQPDKRDVAPDKAYTLSFSGSLTAVSGTYDRIYTGAVDASCGAPANDSMNDGMAFDMICIEVSDTQPIELIVDPATTFLTDTVLTLYCDPFDPGSPGDNVIAFDDDDGVSTLSAITAADDVRLTPGQEYWLVISTYGAGMYGDFAIQSSDNVFSCGDVPLERTTWGAVKGQFR
jgi:hypothetical protein